MTPKQPSARDRRKHKWEIDQDCWSWCRCGTLRWQRTYRGRWYYMVPDHIMPDAGCTRLAQGEPE